MLARVRVPKKKQCVMIVDATREIDFKNSDTAEQNPRVPYVIFGLGDFCNTLNITRNSGTVG